MDKKPIQVAVDVLIAKINAALKGKNMVQDIQNAIQEFLATITPKKPSHQDENKE